MTDINKLIDQMVEQEVPRAAKSEAEYRKNLINVARQVGCEHELRQIFARYDAKLGQCTNPQERKHIAVAGILEVNNLLNCRGGLAINNIGITPGNPSIKDG